MIDLVKFDFIKKFKKPITWFVIIVLCISIGINFLEIQKDQTTRSFAGHNAIGVSSHLLNLADALFDDTEKEAYPTAYESYELMDQIGLGILNTIPKNDYAEASRLLSLWSLTNIKEKRLGMDPMSDILVKNDIYDIWLDVADGIPYESVDFRPIGTSDSSSLNWFHLSADYHRNLYINDWEPIYNDEVNNLNAVYSYFFKLLPVMIFLLIILFTYNNINKDKNNESLKLVLTQSINRGKYYFSKWASSVLHILTITFIPPVFMSIVGGFIGGFSSLKYPIFYLNNIFTRLTPIPNYFDSVAKEFTDPTLFRRVFGHVAPSHHENIVFPHEDIDLIPFYKYIVLVIILTVLFVMFLVAFVQLISAIVNHEIISLVASSGLIAIFVYLGLPFTQESSYNFNPFTFSNTSRIVEGTLNVTVLTSTLIMLISTGVLLAVGYRYFKKKEI